VAGPDGNVMHAELRIGNGHIMLSDALRNPPTQSSTHLAVEDAVAWWARAVAAGATVAMPLADMFWGDRYGIVTDPWGNRWSIATHTEDVAPDELRRRMDGAMKQFAGRPPSLAPAVDLTTPRPGGRARRHRDPRRR
jgi:hypothetical protein